MELHFMKMESPEHEKHHFLKNSDWFIIAPVMVININLALVSDFSGKHMVLITKLLRLDGNLKEFGSETWNTDSVKQWRKSANLRSELGQNIPFNMK